MQACDVPPKVGVLAGIGALLLSVDSTFWPMIPCAG